MSLYDSDGHRLRFSAQDIICAYLLISTSISYLVTKNLSLSLSYSIVVGTPTAITGMPAASLSRRFLLPAVLPGVMPVSVTCMLLQRCSGSLHARLSIATI